MSEWNEEPIILVRRMVIPPPIEEEEGDMDTVCRDDQVREILARESVASILIVFKDGAAIEYAKDDSGPSPAPEL